MRDSQRSKVYKAEKVLEPFSKPLPTIADLKEFVLQVRTNTYLRRRYEYQLQDHIHVGDCRGRRRGGGNSTEIKMPVFARFEWYALHELAHTLTARYYRGQRDVAIHGWQYCGIYLDLVRFTLGLEAHDALKASFKAHRVRFAPKATRTMSEAAKAILRERLAFARGQKK